MPECLAWCWGRGVCCLNHQMRTPPQKGRDLGVLHQLLGVTISDQKVPPLSLCSHYPSPPPTLQGDLLLLFISSTSMD